MFDLAHLSGPMVGLIVFIALLAMRCGVLWLTGSAVIATMAANDPAGTVGRVMQLLGSAT